MCLPALSDGASCNSPSQLARRPLIPPRSSPSDCASCNSTIASRTRAVDSALVPKKEVCSKKKLTWADVVARRPLATQESPPKKKVVLRSVPPPSRQMPAPLAMSGSSTDTARIKRGQAAKRAHDEKPCILRRLRPTRIEVSWSDARVYFWTYKIRFIVVLLGESASQSLPIGLSHF